MITYIPTLLDLFTHFKANGRYSGFQDNQGRSRKGFRDLRTGREDCRKECCFVKARTNSSLSCIQGRWEVREKMQKPGGENKQDACPPPTHRVSLCKPDWPQTHSVGQIGLQLREINSLGSASLQNAWIKGLWQHHPPHSRNLPVPGATELTPSGRRTWDRGLVSEPGQLLKSFWRVCQAVALYLGSKEFTKRTGARCHSDDIFDGKLKSLG